MRKPRPAKISDEVYKKAMGEHGLSPNKLRLLSSGLTPLRAANDKTVNRIEFNAITAMIAYVANEQRTEIETVHEILTSHFNVNTVAALPSRLYQNAIEFLVDLKIINILN